ncbi:hypothetical protein EUA93_06575 [Nocardioides oleivorans]|uniref:Uncharacterized protein n=1 Tax=Nocardioides oleivorans TaxID=273676 RepID=A0A4Q2S0Z9_9ACTN|nr:hypothetical protein [Nocardioides oleivorans]RYB94045.1 hypothetical protein EUA93_06575 [Nocardioides oleivorans]
MTEPDLTPEQEAVRRLLADARHDGPTPPEVVARLDDALASLVAERASSPLPSERPPAPVVDLGARRRRTVGIGLLAAAAVVVAGVGLGQVLPIGSGTSNDSASSADGGGVERELGDQPADGGGSDGGGSSDSQLAPESQKSVSPFAGTPTVTADDPALRDELLVARSTAPAPAAGSGTSEAYAACDLPDLGRGRQVGAEVDGQPGLIVFRRPSGAAQQVELYVCGTAEPVRTITLPAP